MPAATETTGEPQASAIAVAVANWAYESNGRTEARTFLLSEPVTPERLAGTLAALGLRCLLGVSRDEPASGDAEATAADPDAPWSEGSRYEAFATSPDGVWKQLFKAAAQGGAYNTGVAGAYGRLAAWRSMATLADTHLDAPVDEVERRIRDCAWYGFGTDGEWYAQVGWDIGVAAVGPDGRRPAIVAATDTD